MTTPLSANERLARSRRVLEVVEEAVELAASQNPIHSPHEGYAILREYLERVWDAIIANEGDGKLAGGDAATLAVFAVRYCVELCPAPLMESHVSAETRALPADRDALQEKCLELTRANAVLEARVVELQRALQRAP